MKNMIEAHYVAIGGVLCGLMLKMDAWEDKFGKGRGGLVSKPDFHHVRDAYGHELHLRDRAKSPRHQRSAI